MNEAQLKERTKVFGLRALKVIEALPETRSGRVLANQLGRSATSVGANYRSACRSRSVAEMISKISIFEEEADEPAYWLEMIVDHGLMSAPKVMPLHTETGEITAMMVASRKTLSAGNRKSRIENRKSAA